MDDSSQLNLLGDKGIDLRELMNYEEENNIENILQPLGNNEEEDEVNEEFGHFENLTDDSDDDEDNDFDN